MTRSRSPAAMLGLVAASLLVGLPSPAVASPEGLRPLHLTAQEILCASEGRWCAPERMEMPTAREVVARAVVRQAADPRIRAMIARTELAVPAPAAVTVTRAEPERRAVRATRAAGGCLGYRC